MKKTLLAVFADRVNAEEAIGVLEDRGYNPKDMSIIMKDSAEKREVADATGVNTADGAMGGAVAGATVGGIAGLVSAYAIPGLGAFLIGGPLAVALGLTGAAAAAVTGATTGALAGGLIGALTGLGLSEDEARIYQTRIKEGALLVAVPLAGDADEADVKEILRTADAENIRVVTHEEESKRHGHLSA